MKAVPEPRRHYRLRLQAIMSAGEAVGEAVFAYCRDQLGVIVNEMFGQTEINYVVGNCACLWPACPGSMGRAYPGHRVAVIDEEGQPVPPGTVGEVAIHRCDVHGGPDPVYFWATVETKRPRASNTLVTLATAGVAPVIRPWPTRPWCPSPMRNGVNWSRLTWCSHPTGRRDASAVPIRCRNSTDRSLLNYSGMCVRSWRLTKPQKKLSSLTHCQ